MANVANYAELERIGNALYERSASGTLDFAAFQELFAEARLACGPDEDALEMFCAYAKPAAWWNWLRKQNRQAPSKRVA